MTGWDRSSLQSCCRDARYARLPALLGPNVEDSILAPMLYDLVGRHAPNRLAEIHETPFGAFYADQPFWGVYETSRCNECGRQLHVLAIDALLVTVIDAITRRLYPLLDPDRSDDLVFRQPTEAEARSASRQLSRLVFRAANAGADMAEDVARGRPYWWLTEAMTLAHAFLVVHETSHQGPQASAVFDPARYVPAALAGAARHGLQLTAEQALAWAKELAADLNAFLIIETDSSRADQSSPDRDRLRRARLGGVALALKASDLALREFTYGDELAGRQLLGTHPPAEWRIEHLLRRAGQMSEFLQAPFDRSWADRIMRAANDLYAATERIDD